MKKTTLFWSAVIGAGALALAAYYVFHHSEREKTTPAATEGQRMEMAKMLESRGETALKLHQLQAQLALYEQMQAAAPQSADLQRRIADTRKLIQDLQSK